MKSKAEKTSGSETSTWTQHEVTADALRRLKVHYDEMKAERAERSEKEKK